MKKGKIWCGCGREVNGGLEHSREREVVGADEIGMIGGEEKMVGHMFVYDEIGTGSWVQRIWVPRVREKRRRLDRWT